MSPPVAVAEKLCCAATTDSRPSSPVPFRRHSQQPKLDGNVTTQQPLLAYQEPNTSHNGDDLIELQQIFAEAGSTLPPSAGPASSMVLLGQNPRSRPATAIERSVDEDKNDNKPKKRKLLKRLTRELSRSNLSLPNLKKAAAAKEKTQKEQQQQKHSSSDKKLKNKKSKEKGKKDDGAAVEMRSVGPETREVLLSRAYDPDAASLPDIRDSVVERLSKRASLSENGEERPKPSPIRGKRSMERRGDVSNIDWSGNGTGTGPYGWGEPSSSAPAISVRVPERLSDLGVLPSCNVSAEGLLQLNAPSGRSSPWKKFAEQHLRRRSKSADELQPSTPDLKPTKLPSLPSSMNSKAWYLSTDETPAFAVPPSEAKRTIPEPKIQEETQDRNKLNDSFPHFQNKLPFSSPPTTKHGNDITYRNISEALPNAEQDTLNTDPGFARRVLINPPPSNLPDAESASVHLHDMRISQHLRSESTLSGITDTQPTETQQPRQRSARGSVVSGVSGLGVPPSLHAQQSNGMVRNAAAAPRKLRCSSSGFASERVPEAWGNVVSAAPSSVYEPSSVYSTRQNSLSSSSCTPAELSRVSVGGPDTIVRNSGYEILNLSDVGVLRMADAETDEKMKACGKEISEEPSAMPGAFPPSSSTNLLNRADTGLTFRTANERLEATEKDSDTAHEEPKRLVYEFEDFSDHTTDVGEHAPLKPKQQGSGEMTDSSLDTTPVTAVEPPASSEKTPQAQVVTPAPSKQPSSAKNKKKTPSTKTPSKRFSTFSFFRSKTYANLRRASHSPALRVRKISRSEEHLVLDDPKDKAHKEIHGLNIHTDGTSDPHIPSRSQGPPDSRQQEPMVSEAIEDHQPGRLSRSWLIGDGRNSLGQGTMWKKALQRHQEEKSSLFLSPERGGKAEARGLYRERSGSGSALSTRSQLSDRKGKGKAPVIGDDFTFVGIKSGLRRSPTALLDPLETGAEMSLVQQGGTSGMLGDELRQSKASGALMPMKGPSPGASSTDEPSVVSIERDLHIDTWGGTTLADIDLGDLGAWSRYSSHTREERTGPAGEADDVRTRDFAYEMIDASGIENESSNEEDEPNISGAKRVTTLRSKKLKTRSGLSQSKSMTFSRNFGFLKQYIGLFRSQSEEFRRHGHGHRSSIAEGGTLEHPELEILPPVFSPVTFEIPGSPPGLQTDGATSEENSVEEDKKANAGEVEAEGNKTESQTRQIAMTNRRKENNTDSSDGSWAANARLWTHSLGNEVDHRNRSSQKKAESLTEWWSNARTWTRFSTPSQDFQDILDDARQRAVFTPTRLRQMEDPGEGTTTPMPAKVFEQRAPMTKRSKRAQQSSSEEWRSDARLFSQMYESCVQMPNFSSSEDANAYEATAKKQEVDKNNRNSSSSSAFGLASTGYLNGMVTQTAASKEEQGKIRTLSGSYAGNAGKKGEGPMKNDSVLDIGSVGGSTMDLMRYLQDLEDSAKIKLKAEKKAEM